MLNDTYSGLLVQFEVFLSGAQRIEAAPVPQFQLFAWLNQSLYTSRSFQIQATIKHNHYALLTELSVNKARAFFQCSVVCAKGIK